MREPPLRELQEALFDLKALKKHKGYERLLLAADDQVKGRVDNLVLNPLQCMDEVLKQEYAKGEIHGIRLFMAMTDDQIDVLESEIDKILKKETEHVEDEV